MLAQIPQCTHEHITAKIGLTTLRVIGSVSSEMATIYLVIFLHGVVVIYTYLQTKTTTLLKMIL